MNAELIGIEWGVRRAWRAYVMGLSDGRFDARDGAALEPQSVIFPVADASEWDDAGGTLKCQGSLTAYGHFGMTLGHVIDPWVESSGERFRLTVVRWPGRPERIPLADLRSNPCHGPAAASLTIEGTEIFGGVYAQGTELDPVHVLVSELDAEVRDETHIETEGEQS